MGGAISAERVVAAGPTRPIGAARTVVVALNQDGKELLLACLEAVARLEPRPLAVVVVDNGSSDGSADAVRERFPAVHVLREPVNRGVAGGRNVGLRWALRELAIDWVLFIDNDTLVEPATLGELVAAAGSDPEVGLVAPKAFRQRHDPRLLSAGGLSFNPYTGAVQDVASGETDRGDHESARDIQACPGFAFLVRKQVFERIGEFDETFNPYGWEDVDFSLRAGRAGFRLIYAPRAVVYHAGGRAGRGPVPHYERHKARTLLYLVRRNATPLQWCCFLMLLVFRGTWRIAYELASGNGGVVRAWAKGLVGRGPEAPGRDRGEPR